jgi:GNAT superfamily N-acetyltransferase
MDFSIRTASSDDAAGAAEVIARAIRISCIADHGNDEQKLSGWLADKSQTKVEFVIDVAPSGCFVAERAGVIVGFAAVSNGTLLQLYVDPNASGLGIGRALLETAEQCARVEGYKRITLDSTQTAQPFYRHMGYMDASRPQSAICGVICYPMNKSF